LTVVVQEGGRKSTLHMQMDSPNAAILELSSNDRSVKWALQLPAPKDVRNRVQPSFNVIGGDPASYRHEAAKSRALAGLHSLLGDAIKPGDSMPARLLTAAVRTLAIGTQDAAPRPLNKDLSDCFDGADSTYNSCEATGQIGVICTMYWA